MELKNTKNDNLDIIPISIICYKQLLCIYQQMGTSMSDALNAERNRLQMRAKSLANLTQKNNSLKNKTQIIQPAIIQRPLSHDDRLQNKLKLRKIKELKDKKDQSKYQLNNTPAFSSQIVDNYLDKIEPKKQNFKSSQMKKTKTLNAKDCQNNYFIFAEKDKQRQTIQQNNKEKRKCQLQAMVKLPLNSLIKEESQELHITFSEAIISHFPQRNQNIIDDIKFSPQNSHKANSLLIRIKQKDKNIRFLNKYLPKSKMQKKQFFKYQKIFQEQNEPVKISLKCSKLQNPQPKQDININYSQKIYKKWKSRERSRKDSILNSQNKCSGRIGNVNDCYGIANYQEQIQHNRKKPKYPNKLIAYNNKKSNQKPTKSNINQNINQKILQRTHRQSIQSEKKLKLIYF